MSSAHSGRRALELRCPTLRSRRCRRGRQGCPRSSPGGTSHRTSASPSACLLAARDEEADPVDTAPRPTRPIRGSVKDYQCRRRCARNSRLNRLFGRVISCTPPDGPSLGLPRRKLAAGGSPFGSSAIRTRKSAESNDARSGCGRARRTFQRSSHGGVEGPARGDRSDCSAGRVLPVYAAGPLVRPFPPGLRSDKGAPRPSGQDPAGLGMPPSLSSSCQERAPVLLRSGERVAGEKVVRIKVHDGTTAAED